MATEVHKAVCWTRMTLISMGIDSYNERQIRKLPPNDSQKNNALSNVMSRIFLDIFMLKIFLYITD